MFRSQTIRRQRNMVPIDAPETISDLAWIDRSKATLLRNPMIGGDELLAKKIIAKGTLQRFPPQATLIKQGECDDHIYFLISGNVDVLIDGKLRDKKFAPSSIGELAASEPHIRRTATVRAHAEVVVLRVDGAEFRSLANRFESISEGLKEVKSDMLHARLSDKVELKEHRSPEWVAIATFAALVFGAAAFALLKFQFALATAGAVSVSAAIGAVCFVFMLMNNPKYFYRSMFRLSVLSLVSYACFGWVFVVEGVRVEVQNSNAGNPLAYTITLLVLLSLAALCAWKDKN